MGMQGEGARALADDRSFAGASVPLADSGCIRVWLQLAQYNYYEDLTPESVVQIVDKLKKGEKPRVGSQIRDVAEPVKGQTTLLEKPPGPYCRDIDAAT
jgi:hypothetical protein